MIRTSEGNITYLAKLKQIINAGIALTPKTKFSIKFIAMIYLNNVYLVFKECTASSST